MANKKAAKKDILTNKRNNIRNTHFKSLMKTRIKLAESAIDTKNKEAASIIRIALKQIDKTASKGIIHKNAAARKKSSLAKKLNNLKS
ncbi:30S ribosomal protein S20 [Candidatus Marinamargulisbacteria bacterium SCGC AG-333-B06]|nr:30S ribosomal protein S20 [Candidatus Marinamargulisbacteria bacterium SCGC AG-333-B06]